MLLSGLVAGAHGAVGSTYNFLGRLCGEVINALQQGDLAAARTRQGQAVRIVQVITGLPLIAALKATMALSGIDCGPPRRPLRTLDDLQHRVLERGLHDAGFFQWAGGPGDGR
jgi:N-acetylneuraminate lyase